MEGKEDEIKTVIGENFNARTRKEAERIREENKGKKKEKRKSINRKKNKD